MTGWIAAIDADPPSWRRDSAPERVARLLRERVTAGVVPPGERLPEDELARALRVSRNTLREAFRMLGHERLVVHELNRGMFVRTLTAADVADIFRLRRILEGEAAGREGPLDGLGAAVSAGRAAAGRGDWAGVATADIGFHHALVARLGSPRVSEVMERTLAELRLAFHAIGDPGPFHRPYIDWNERILSRLARGESAAAVEELEGYLRRAEAELVAAHRS